MLLFIINIIHRKETISDIDLKNALWLLPFLFILALISYYGSYGGGKGYFSFPVDEILIIILGICSYYLATYSRLNEEKALYYLREAQEYKEDEALSVFEEKAPFEIEIETEAGVNEKEDEE